MKTVRLKEALKIYTGKTKPNSFGNIPIYGGNGILGYSNISNVVKPMVIIGRVGAYCGVVHFENKPFWLTDNALGVIQKDGFELKYLRYLLECLDLHKIAVGAAQPLMTQSIINNLKVKFPDTIEQQQAIAKVLTSLDDKIELNKKVNVVLEQMMRDIYNYWFVQFDFPDTNGKPYKSSGGKMVLREELKREIPEGWEVKSFSNNSLFSYVKNGMKNFDKNKVYYATADIDNNGISGIGELVNFDNKPNRANMQPCKNTVWFAKMKDSTKHIILSNLDDPLIENSIFSTGMVGLQCNDDNFEYISSIIKFSDFETEKNSQAHGATQQSINNSDLNNIQILQPLSSVLKNYSKSIKSILQKIQKNRLQSQQLAKLRDFLLPMLMNGQVEVKECC
jgi:type I restriction enzyme S subunit